MKFVKYSFYPLGINEKLSQQKLDTKEEINYDFLGLLNK